MLHNHIEAKDFKYHFFLLCNCVDKQSVCVCVCVLFRLGGAARVKL